MRRRRNRKNAGAQIWAQPKVLWGAVTTATLALSLVAIVPAAADIVPLGPDGAPLLAVGLYDDDGYAWPKGPPLPETDMPLPDDVPLPETGPVVPELVVGGISMFEPEPNWEPLPWDIERGPNWTDRVLLTYDDCMNDPERFTEVLDRATELNIGLMIFPTGNCVLMFRNLWDIDLPQLIRDRGHWVGNHSSTHPHLTQLSPAEIVRQISGWPESNLLRPPFGDWNQRVYDAASSQGMRLVMWTLDTDDWQGRSEAEIIDHIVTYAEPGDNVLMHLQHQAFTPAALEGIQAGLRERGIELCRPARPEERPTPVDVPDNIC